MNNVQECGCFTFSYPGDNNEEVYVCVGCGMCSGGEVFVMRVWTEFGYTEHSRRIK